MPKKSTQSTAAEKFGSKQLLHVLNMSKDHRISRLGALKALGVPKTRATLDHLSDVIDDLNAKKQLEKIRGHSVCLPRRPDSIRRGTLTEFQTNFLGALERAETQQLSRVGALKAMGLQRTRKNLDRLAQIIDALHLEGSVQKLGGHSVCLLADSAGKRLKGGVGGTAVPPPVTFEPAKRPVLNMLNLSESETSPDGKTDGTKHYKNVNKMTLNRPGARLHELVKYEDRSTSSGPLVWVDSFDPEKLNLCIVPGDSDERWLYQDATGSSRTDDLTSQIFKTIHSEIDELKKQKTTEEEKVREAWNNYKETMEGHLDTNIQTWPSFMETANANKEETIKSVLQRVGQLSQNIEALHEIAYVKLTFPNSKQELSLPAYTIVKVEDLGLDGDDEDDVRLFYQPATDQRDDSSFNHLKDNRLLYRAPGVRAPGVQSPYHDDGSPTPTTYQQLKQEKRNLKKTGNSYSITIRLPVKKIELVVYRVDSINGEPGEAANISEQGLDEKVSEEPGSTFEFKSTAENGKVHECSVYSNFEGKKVIHIKLGVSTSQQKKNLKRYWNER
jgi:hypothetical protein